MCKSSVKKNRGLTLVELLVALMVTSIVLTAVATLAFAMSTANDSTGDVSKKQAQVRFTAVRLGELIKYSKLICVPNGSDDLAVWRADADSDNEIDPNELVYIETGSSRNYIKLLEFPTAAAGIVSLSSIINGSAKSSLISSFDERRISLVPQCSNVQFYPANASPQNKAVSILFDIPEDEIDHHYQISATILSWAGNLLDSTGSSIVIDDD